MLRIAITLASVLSALLPADPAAAQWASREDSPIVLESSHDHFYVHADGSYDNESEFEISVQKEQGIDEMKLFRFPYDPNVVQMTVTEASTTNGTSVLPVAPAMIEDKPVASHGEGLTSMNQITIPFPAVAVGSRLKVKMKHHGNAPYVPGLMNIRLTMARHMFTNADVSEFKSELPLVVKHRGASDLVTFEEGKEGNLYTLKVSMQRPAFRMLAREYSAAITEETFPRIEVGAAGHDWGEMARFFSPKIEEALKEPLPPDFSAILAEASKEKTGVARAKVAMAKLIDRMKYLGDWRNERGYYLPRTLAQIATTKQGDCKDFSFATVAILRWLGIPATMAFVHRGPEDTITGLLSNSMRTFDPLLPGMGYFNHAILLANIDGANYWLDPTNPVAHVGAPFSDIADRSALVLDARTTGLSRIPKNESSNSLKVTSYYAFRATGKADVMSEVRLKGSQVNDLERAAAMAPEKVRKFALLGGIQPPGHISYEGVVSEIEPDAVPKAVPGEELGLFTYVVENKGAKTSLGNSFPLIPSNGIRMLTAPGGGRVTGILLGDPTVETRKSYLANFLVQGDPPADCSVDSPWVSGSRKFSKQQNGLIWTDELTTKVPEISLGDANSKDFEDFQKKLEKCFDKSLLVYKWQLPETRKKGFVAFHNPMIPDRKKLHDRALAIGDDTAQDFERYTYAKMLLHEAVQSGSDESAAAIGSLAFDTMKQAFRSSLESDPDEIEESEDLFKLALARDPDEVAANLHLSGQAHKLKQYSTEAEIYHRILEKHPKSTGANLGKLSSMLDQATSGPLRENAIRTALSRTEELLADPEVSCKKCIVSFQMSIYEKQNDRAGIEKSYRKLIELQPKSSWALLNFASYLVNHARFAEAEEFSRKAIKVANVGMAHITLAGGLSGQAVEEFLKDPLSKKGMSLCEEAFENERSNLNCMFSLGYIYERLGQRDNDAHLTELSKQFKEQALKLSSEQRVSSGMWQQGLGQLRQLVTMDPNGVFARKVPVAPTPVAAVPQATPAAPPAAVVDPAAGRAPASVPSPSTQPPKGVTP